jgi:hypothetical protein
MSWDQLDALVKQTFGNDVGEFRPCAYFDDRLDCIRVITRDCSVLERRVDARLTILLDNYGPPSSQQCVGLTIKGARHFCREHNLPLDTPIAMGKVLDLIIASCPDIVVRSFIQLVVRPLIEDNKIDHIEMPAPVAA